MLDSSSSAGQDISVSQESKLLPAVACGSTGHCPEELGVKLDCCQSIIKSSQRFADHQPGTCCKHNKAALSRSNLVVYGITICSE